MVFLWKEEIPTGSFPWGLVKQSTVGGEIISLPLRHATFVHRPLVADNVHERTEAVDRSGHGGRRRGCPTMSSMPTSLV